MVEKEKVFSLSRIQLFVTPWTVACQVPLPMEFSRQEYWQKWVAILSPGYLSNPGVEPRSPALQTDSLLSEPPRESTWWGVTHKDANIKLWGSLLVSKTKDSSKPVFLQDWPTTDV